MLNSYIIFLLLVQVFCVIIVVYILYRAILLEYSESENLPDTNECVLDS